MQDGIRRMYQEGEDRFYYIMLYNEDYAMPEMPEGVRRRHPQGHLQVQSRLKARRRSRAAVRQRPDPE